MLSFQPLKIIFVLQEEEKGEIEIFVCFPIVLAFFAFSWNVKCFPFFFYAENWTLIFFWLISMYFSHRILALISNAGLWLFLL